MNVLADIIALLPFSGVAIAIVYGIFAFANRTSNRATEDIRKTTIGVDLAKPGSDRTAIANLRGREIAQVWYDEAALIDQRALAKLEAEMFAKMANPPIICDPNRPMTAQEVAARSRQAQSMHNQYQAALAQAMRQNASGLLSGVGRLGMPNFASSAGTPLPPGLSDSGVASSPTPTEAPTAVIPNLLAGVNEDEVKAFLDTTRTQQAKAPADERKRYDAMIEAGEKRLAEIAAAREVNMKLVHHAMEMLAKNDPSNPVVRTIGPGSTIFNPVEAAGVIGEIMKDML